MKKVGVLIFYLLASSAFYPPFNFSAENQPEKKSTDLKYSTPNLFFVQSKDGREKFRISCYPEPWSMDFDAATKVKCKFLHSRVEPPRKDDAAEKFITEMEKAAQSEPGFFKEAKENMEKICKEKDTLLSKAKARGPKSEKLFQEIFGLCSTGDVLKFYRNVTLMESKTCGLWIDHFELTFEKNKPGHWISINRPGRLFNIVKIYELQQIGNFFVEWKLTEKRIKGEGESLIEKMEKATGEKAPQGEKFEVTVWSWDFPSDHELPCDFLKH